MDKDDVLEGWKEASKEAAGLISDAIDLIPDSNWAEDARKFLAINEKWL